MAGYVPLRKAAQIKNTNRKVLVHTYTGYDTLVTQYFTHKSFRWSLLLKSNCGNYILGCDYLLVGWFTM